MGIMTRLLRIWKADVHGVMDQLEDKELLLKQHLREMQTSLTHKERRVDTLTQGLGSLAGQIMRHAREMDKLERDLIPALEKEKDDIARLLIRRRRALETASSHLKERLETMTQEKTKLSETVAHQRLQYETLSAKAGSFSRQAGNHPFEGDAHFWSGTIYEATPSDEEIELELLQRKDALRKGGTPCNVP
jgi:phage shock protein A